ncbi:unnamed protein product [Hyaloperonospora brassicae]|uniref:RxLR effector candidate protein n=1 Tax=Hyaloperonospora brassicae TaxID=162125 RepID=A0AAV0UWP6_HYABA|nr:unnamed protein product [Hyaloperonospora brassicae]
MHLLCSLATCLVIGLWRTTDSSPTSSDRTDDAFKLPTAFPRVKTNASSIAPSLLEPYDSAVNVIDLNQPNDEERVGFFDEEALSKALLELENSKVFLDHLHPSHFFAGINAQEAQEEQVMADFARWIKYDDAFGKKYNTDRVYKNSVIQLMDTVKDEEKLVSLLLAFAKVPDEHDRASLLKRELRKAKLKLLKPDFIKWREDNLRPDEVYDMMRIGLEKRLIPSESAAKWYIVFQEIVLWLYYVREFNSEQKLYLANHVLFLLVEKRGQEEVVLFLHWLREESGLLNSVSMADTLQELMLLAYPETVDTMLLLWLGSDMRPYDVYERLVFAARRHMPQEVSPEEKQQFLLYKLIQWFTYIDVYVADGRFIFTDDDTVRVMIDFGTYFASEEVVESLTSLISVDGMEDRAIRLLVVLISKHVSSFDRATRNKLLRLIFTLHV